VEGPLNDALRNIESARSRLESCEDMYSQCGVKDSGVTQAIDDAGRAVVAAEHVQQVHMGARWRVWAGPGARGTFELHFPVACW
jgi:hypothetical protein